MIISAAIIGKDGGIYTGLRHCFIINRQTPNTKHLPEGFFRGGEQGFVDDKGNFLNREQAAKYVIECGQCTPGKANIKHVFDGKTLYSEDYV